MSRSLVLSCFPGIGLLDRAFEEEGFCVVRGPDLLRGGNICTFSPPAGVFQGVIGGPPCKSFTSLVHMVRQRGYEPKHGNLIPEFERVVAEAAPEWFLMENVPRAPIPTVVGYLTRDLVLNNRWLGEEQSRTRRFSFGTHGGTTLVVDVALFEAPVFEPAVVAAWGGFTQDRGGRSRPNATVECVHRAAKRTTARLAELQGLDPDFLAEAPFTDTGKREAISQGVPLPMGRAIARAVRRALCLD